MLSVLIRRRLSWLFSVLPLVIYTRSHRKWTHLASNETTDTTTISEAERTHKLSAQRGEDTEVLHDGLSLGVSADSKPYWMIRQHSLFDERHVFPVDTVHLISLMLYLQDLHAEFISPCWHHSVERLWSVCFTDSSIAFEINTGYDINVQELPAQSSQKLTSMYFHSRSLVNHDL